EVQVGVQRVVVVGHQVIAAVDLGVVLRAPGIGQACAEPVVLEERADVDLVLGAVGQVIAAVGLGIGIGVVREQAQAAGEVGLERSREPLDGGAAGIVRTRNVVLGDGVLSLVEVALLAGGDQDV